MSDTAEQINTAETEQVVQQAEVIEQPKEEAVAPAAEENAAPAAAAEEAKEEVSAPAPAPAAEEEEKAAPTSTALVAAAEEEEEQKNEVSAQQQQQHPPELYANAIECAQSRREPKIDRSTTAMRYLLGITNSAKHGDVGNAHELVRALEEEDAKLFSEIPRDLKGRKSQRVSDGREGSIARREEYHNKNYHLPEKHIACSPRSIVDIRRPLTARYDPSSPEARKSRNEGSNTSRYRGLSQGDLSCLENDPIYQPSPESRRKLIEKEKEQERAKMVKPHSPAAIAKKKGPVVKEQTFTKKSADWYPNLVNLAENRNSEGKMRRQEVQSRMSTHTFK